MTEAQIKTEEKCKKAKHCPFSMGYKFLVLVMLSVILYSQYNLQKNNFTREILLEELSNTQNNLISSFSKNLQNSEQEKTVIDVLKENLPQQKECEFQDNSKIISELKKLTGKVKRENDIKQNIILKSLELRKEILSKLNQNIKNINEIKPENKEPSDKTIKDTGAEILSKFVKIKNVENIKNNTNFILKRKFIKLPELLLNNRYNEVINLFEEASNLLEDEKYKTFSNELKSFKNDFPQGFKVKKLKFLINRFEN